LSDRNKDIDESLSDIRNVDGKKEVFVVLGLNIIAEVLDSRAPWEVEERSGTGSVDGGRKSLTIVENGNGGIKELNKDF